MSYTVLIVDSHAHARLQLRTLLAPQHPNWHFLEASSAAEAIDHSIREPIQLISIEPHLPADLAQQLHALLPRSTIVQWCETPELNQTQRPQLHYVATPINAAAIEQLLQFTAPSH